MITLLNEKSLDFPAVDEAMVDPNGLLAMGGDLSIPRLIHAYHHGIFPWFNPGQPFLWWSPNPRAVLYLDELHLSRSLVKILRHKPFTLTINRAFAAVIRACALPRPKQPETWLSEEMIAAYCDLHAHGLAHSIEVWLDQKLIGGLYGVDCGRVFTGESMFALEPNAAKVALVFLVNHLKNYQYEFIDCQILNPFLEQLGAREIPRERFITALNKGLSLPPTLAWQRLS
jgi:leucyl/phenylalanyl-tRNA--protein transferase